MLKNVYKTHCRHLLRNFSSVVVTNLETETSLKKIKKKPFIKNLLVGKFNDEFLIYPELSSEKLKKLEIKYLSLPKPSSNASKDSFNQLVNIVSDANSENQNTYSELNRLSEAIPSLPLAILIEIQNVCLNKIISRYCNDAQKQKYLPELQKGTKSIAFALSEEVSGSDPSSIETVAIKDKATSKWRLNGVKPWVTNAQNADLFIVFSKIKLHEKSPGTKDLSVFLVDKKSQGVSIEKKNSNGFEECGLGKLILSDVSLTDENLIGHPTIGYNVATELLSSFKQSFACCFSSQLKLLLNETIRFLSPRKQSMIDLKDCESIRKKLSGVFVTIYTLDSMLYLTSGLMDSYDIDTTLESAIIHLYCIQNGVEAVNKCLEMLGSNAFDKSLPFYKISQDLKGLSNVFHTKDISKLYISMTGIQSAAQIVGDDVHKVRNSFNFPSFFIKKMLSNRRNANDSPKLNLKLYTNLHPSLEAACNQLEYCVIRMQYCLEMLLVRHGSEIAKRQVDLERISDLLLDIYGMTAILGRASRSYCTGIKYADDEVLLAKAYCLDAYNRCKVTVNGILNDDLVANDLFHFKLAGHLFQHGSYFIEHPLTQNID